MGYAMSGDTRAADRDIEVPALAIDIPAEMISDDSNLWMI